LRPDPALALDPAADVSPLAQPAELTVALDSLAGMLAPGGAVGSVPLCSCALCQAAARGAAGSLVERLLSMRKAPERTAPSQRDSLPGSVASGPSAAPVTGLSTPVASSLRIADADLFNLDSNPGADKTIYLNFLGANLSGTAWIPTGSSWNGVAPVFSLDGDVSTNFSAAERAAIKEIFVRVACDYAPFNVNVTTKAPALDRINRSSLSDNVYGTVCLFSNISGQTGFPNSGGVAYVGVFNGVNLEKYKPALVFPNKLSNNAKSIAEAASHEIGHNLNLNHDGSGADAYYAGQGTSPGWAPIMGVGYYKQLTQFSRGSYSGATNTENDFSQITGQGLGYWLDSVGNDAASAVSLSLSLTDANADGISDKLQIGGTIELTRSDGLGLADQDFYGFLAPSDGSVTINIRNALCFFDPAVSRYTFAPVPAGFGNLRLDARLQDSAGNVMADWSNNASLDVADFKVEGLQGGQNYYVSVYANAASPDGEDTYGSLGDYVLDLVYTGQAPLQAQAPVVSISAIGGADSVVSAQAGDATVVGTAEANRSVTLLFNGTALGTTTTDGNGGFEYGLTAANLTTIGQGSGKAITASQSDGAGNVGSSAPFGFSVDTLVPAYSISAPASLLEGQSFVINIATTNLVDGSVLGWRFSGTGIISADLAPASLTGSVTVSGGAASLTLLVTADNNLEPTETGLFELLVGTTAVASSTIALVDTNSRWGTTGVDTIVGTDNRFERITGVPASGITSPELGAGQRDVVTGGVGPDEFLLSELRQGALRVFYNDGAATNTGTSDYLRVTDFKSSEDRLRFGGGRYFSRNNGSDTWIWYDRNNNGSLNTNNFQSTTDELIAVLSGVNLGNATMLNGSTATPSWAVFA
jgi:hypothetical protein